jgi:hypothetical protein
MNAKRFAIVADTVFDGIAARRDCAVWLPSTAASKPICRAWRTDGPMSRRRVLDQVGMSPRFIGRYKVNGGGVFLFNGETTIVGICQYPRPRIALRHDIASCRQITDTDGQNAVRAMRLQASGR